MNLVLTMAGKYRRFRLFGSKVPKYLLPLRAETLLAEVIKQFLTSVPSLNIYLIANRDDQIFYPVVRSIMKKYLISNQSLVYIDDTSSQLETALAAQDLLTPDQQFRPIAFANIDTVLFERNDFFQELDRLPINSGLLDTFRGESKQYSYVRVGADSKVVDIADKSVISDLACSGLYGFSSFSSMTSVGTGLLRRNGEFNFTDLYREYLLVGRDVYAHYTAPVNNTIVLGTPEEYVVNIHRFK